MKHILNLYTYMKHIYLNETYALLNSLFDLLYNLAFFNFMLIYMPFYNKILISHL